MKQSFTMAEAADILGQNKGVLKIWRARDICRYGGDGTRMAYSQVEIIKMAAALSLNGIGIDLKRAFGIMEDGQLGSIFTAIVAGQIWPHDFWLFYVFDPERRGEPRVWGIARREEEKVMFGDPVDHAIPSEAFLRVNMSAIGRRCLKDIQHHG
ncbi:hypothetical protein [Mesorhizobium sp. M0088]|uniref:hypothetical protein n=1 Tax=Mesorhizobium sp. M0088 TaxID=2956873 RepID=UPI00333B7756